MVATSSQIVVLIAGIANAGSHCGADAIGRSEPPLQNYKGAGFSSEETGASAFL